MIIQTKKQMRPREKNDFYPTPYALCHHVINKLAKEDAFPHSEPIKVLDPGAGAGVWGDAVKDYFPNALIAGVELRPEALPNPHYAAWRVGDFRLETFAHKFDWVVGNPPYKHAEEFIRTAMSLTMTGGLVAFLLRMSILGSDGRGRGLWRVYPPEQVWVCAQRPSFTGNRKTDSDEYAVLVWRKGKKSAPVISWMNWR